MIQDVPPAPPEAHAPVDGQGPAFALAGVGRFAVFADLTTFRREPDAVLMRSLQVVEQDFMVGDVAYWGGWSWWRFDCEAETADRLDFASVTSGGAEGPSTPDRQPPYPAAPGGDAAELMDIACGVAAPEVVATTLDQAVAIGRARLAE